MDNTQSKGHLYDSSYGSYDSLYESQLESSYKETSKKNNEYIDLDEWLSYAILFGLYSCEYYVIFGIAVILAIVFNGYGYLSYWRVEEKYNDYLIHELSTPQPNPDTKR